MVRRNVVLGLAAVGVLAMWIWLLVVEILDTLAADAEAGEQVVRTDLRIGVMTLLTGLLGAALAVMVAAGGDQLRDVPRALGFEGSTLPQLFTFLYAVAYVVGILVGLGVAVTNEATASALLIAVSTGGIGTLATGVAAWLGLNFAPPDRSSGPAGGHRVAARRAPRCARRRSHRRSGDVRRGRVVGRTVGRTNRGRHRSRRARARARSRIRPRRRGGRADRRAGGRRTPGPGRLVPAHRTDARRRRSAVRRPRRRTASATRPGRRRSAARRARCRDR